MPAASSTSRIMTAAVATLMAGGSGPVITRKPEGGYSFAVFDAMKQSAFRHWKNRISVLFLPRRLNPRGAIPTFRMLQLSIDFCATYRLRISIRPFACKLKTTSHSPDRKT